MLDGETIVDTQESLCQSNAQKSSTLKCNLNEKKIKKAKKEAKALKKLSRKMTKDYMSALSDYNRLKKYSPMNGIDGKYAENIACSLCNENVCNHIFFPCAHKCVCDTCIEHQNIGTANSTSWRACPVCMAEIKLVLPESGNEIETYWNWVYEYTPILPRNFEKRMKKNTKRLIEKGRTKQNSILSDDYECSVLHDSGSTPAKHKQCSFL